MGVNGKILFKRPRYIAAALRDMSARNNFSPERLLWRAESDSAPKFDTWFDLAAALDTGASVYYVSDCVTAVKKAVFLHEFCEKTRYTHMLDLDCYFYYDKIFASSEEIKNSFIKAYPEYEEKIVLSDDLSEDIIRTFKI